MSKSPSLRRIQADIRELALDPSDRYHAAPLENDMFEWHFTIRGPDDTEFEGGVYHGRILLPAEYPFKPPNIIFLTPSGRFETNTKVCLSFSAFHPELWQPAWGIRLILEALISFLPSPADGAIGALDWTKEERKKLAKKSVDFICPICGNCAALIPKNIPKKAHSSSSNRFQKEIEKLHMLQAAAEGGNKKETNDNDNETEANKEEEKFTLKDNPDSIEEDKQSSESDVTKTTEENINNTDSLSIPLEQGKHTKNDVGTIIKQQAQEMESASSNNSDDQAPPNEADDMNLPATGFETNSTVEQETSDLVVEEMNANIYPEQEGNLLDSPWLSDPIIHTAIVCLACIVFLLVKKVNDIMDEMKALEVMYSQT